MIACSKSTVVLAALGQLDLQLVRRGEPAVAPDGGDLALPGQSGQAAGEPPDHALLPGPQLVDVDRRSTERDAVLAHLPGFGDDLGRVQQGLGRDAADVEADSAQCRPAVDEHDLLAQVGRPERGRVAARPGAEDEHVRGDVTRRHCDVTRRHRTGRRGGWLGRCRGCLGHRSLTGAQVRNDVAGGDVVADRDPDGGDGPGHGRRNVQRGLVRLQGDQRILAGDHVPGGHLHLDDRHIDEVADVGDRDLDDLVNPARRAVAGRLGRRGRRVLGDPLPDRPGSRAAGPGPASSRRMRSPADTRSPTRTATSLTVPAADAGTSSVALSDSSVRSGSSADTTSPAVTCTSMTGTSTKWPMSGTVISTSDSRKRVRHNGPGAVTAAGRGCLPAAGTGTGRTGRRAPRR